MPVGEAVLLGQRQQLGGPLFDRLPVAASWSSRFWWCIPPPACTAGPSPAVATSASRLPASRVPGPLAAAWPRGLAARGDPRVEQDLLGTALAVAVSARGSGRGGRAPRRTRRRTGRPPASNGAPEPADDAASLLGAAQMLEPRLRGRAAAPPGSCGSAITPRAPPAPGRCCRCAERARGRAGRRRPISGAASPFDS